MCLEPVTATAAVGSAAWASGTAAAALQGAVGYGALSMSPLTAFSIGTSVLGAGVSAYGQMQAGKSQKAMYEYQSAVARNNAIVADRAAADAIERGKTAADKSRLETARLKGRQRVVLAGLGQQVDTGSALDITSDTAQLGEWDARTIMSNAEREAYNLKVRAGQFTSEATLNQMAGVNAQTSSFYGAAGTLISGAGSVADKWYRSKFGPTGVSGSFA